MLGSLTIILAHHMYAMPHPYLAIDYGTQLSLFTHHMWIGGFLIVGAAVHAAIFIVRDYDPTTRYNNLLDCVPRHRDAIIIALVNNSKNKWIDGNEQMTTQTMHLDIP